MDQLREAWSNDVLLSMCSAFCVGLGIGVFLLALVVSGAWMFAPLFSSLALLGAGTFLLGRAERVRAERWQRREWR